MKRRMHQAWRRQRAWAHLLHNTGLALGKGDVATRLVGDELDLNLATLAACRDNGRWSATAQCGNMYSVARFGEHAAALRCLEYSESGYRNRTRAQRARATEQQRKIRNHLPPLLSLSSSSSTRCRLRGLSSPSCWGGVVCSSRFSAMMAIATGQVLRG
jgi:hypothetical protein